MTGKLFALLLLALLALSSFQQESADLLRLDNVIIYSISTSIESLNYYRQGSIMGGTYLYIKATGLDQTASNNRVTIGPYECKVPENGVNQMYLTC